jgi:hypothetical protein
MNEEDSTIQNCESFSLLLPKVWKIIVAFNPLSSDDYNDRVKFNNKHQLSEYSLSGTQ